MATSDCRVEIIANQSIMSDLIGIVKGVGLDKSYTLIPTAHGSGNSGPRLGDGVWPEENFMLIIYCSLELEERLSARIADLKKEYSGEGIKKYTIPIIER